MRILKERNGQYYGIKSVKLTEQEMINLDGQSVLYEFTGSYALYEISTSTMQVDGQTVVIQMSVDAYIGTNKDDAEWNDEYCNTVELGDVLLYSENEWIGSITAKNTEYEVINVK